MKLTRSHPRNSNSGKEGLPLRITPSRLHKFTAHRPSRPLGFVKKRHARLIRGAVPLSRIAWKAACNHVFPLMYPTTGPWKDMVNIQLVTQIATTTVLADVIVTSEDIVPSKPDFEGQNFSERCTDHQPGGPNPARWCTYNIIIVLRPLGKPINHLVRLIFPIESLYRPRYHHHKSLAHRDDVDGLIVPIKHEDGTRKR